MVIILVRDFFEAKKKKRSWSAGKVSGEKLDLGVENDEVGDSDPRELVSGTGLVDLKRFCLMPFLISGKGKDCLSPGFKSLLTLSVVISVFWNSLRISAIVFGSFFELISELRARLPFSLVSMVGKEADLRSSLVNLILSPFPLEGSDEFILGLFGRIGGKVIKKPFIFNISQKNSDLNLCYELKVSY
ncbi:MAG: hypothetical protein CMP39_00955 [Rickettsiales bacterium]|nr:hypothetical protein [Rickettsiales bacterium]